MARSAGIAIVPRLPDALERYNPENEREFRAVVERALEDLAHASKNAADDLEDGTVGAGGDHGALSGLTDDDHEQYSLVAGTRAFSGVVGGITPTDAAHLATKGYVDGEVFGGDHGALTGLGDDDHSIYTKADGSRDFTGVVNNTSQPACYVWRDDTNFTVVSGADRDPVYDGETFDRGTLWDAGNKRLLVPTGGAGLYMIFWQTSWQALAGGNWAIMKLFKNTTALMIAPYFDTGTPAQWNAVNTMWLGSLADGDTVSPRLRVANNQVLHADKQKSYLFAAKIW